MFRPMDPADLEALLVRVSAGKTTVEAALASLRPLPADPADIAPDASIAHVDLGRALRQGMPEVVFGEPKTADQIVLIAETLLQNGQQVLVTRVSPEKAEIVRQSLPDLVYTPLARTLSLLPVPPTPRAGTVAVVSAGTSDLGVAEEACETLRMAGIAHQRVYDVGVAGIHRLFARLETIQAADVVIAVAGMEGALPSVLGGLVRGPVVAVPTSVGYGANLAGLTALFSMLTTCASGVVVVNVDNGFGAAMAAHRMLSRREARG